MTRCARRSTDVVFLKQNAIRKYQSCICVPLSWSCSETEAPIVRPQEDYILDDSDVLDLPTTTPSPKRPEGICVKDGAFQDPFQCDRFLVCHGGRKVADMQCPGKLRFNPGLGVCDWPRNVPCPVRQRRPGVEVDFRGRVVCSTEEGFYASPRDCREFFRCHRGEPFRFRCPKGLVFNGVLKICDWPSNVNAADQGSAWRRCRWNKVGLE